MSDIGAALGYNFKKVKTDEAEVLLVSGLSLDSSGNTSLERAMEDMKRQLPLTMRTKKTVFHASLNPHPDDKLSNEDLCEIAAYYIERLGYGDQPYIVFKHRDIEREHIHIVSLRVDANGKKINDSHEHLRSNKIRKEIEQKWGLNSCQTRKQSAEVSNGIKEHISQMVQATLANYHFQSLGELNALLAKHSVQVEEVKREHKGRPYNGLLYAVVDSSGKKIRVPIEAGKLGRHIGR